MNSTSLLRRAVWTGIVSLAALAVVTMVFAPAAAADQCKNRGDLDIRYCDEDGDLLADTQMGTARPLPFFPTPQSSPSVMSVFQVHGPHRQEDRQAGEMVRTESMRPIETASGRLHISGCRRCDGIRRQPGGHQCR
jgi:phosphonate transport system substrate-binding protein